MTSGRAIPDSTWQAALAWYGEDVTRTPEEVGARYGFCGKWFRARLRVEGIPLHPRKRGRDKGPRKKRVRKPKPVPVTTYARVLAEYRAGAELIDIRRRVRRSTEVIGDILRAAGEGCSRCEVLLRDTEPEGIAVLEDGTRSCQACVEETDGHGAVRWERPPVEVVRDYCEISNVYAWEGER